MKRGRGVFGYLRLPPSVLSLQSVTLWLRVRREWKIAAARSTSGRSSRTTGDAFRRLMYG